MAEDSIYLVIGLGIWIGFGVVGYIVGYLYAKTKYSRQKEA